MIKTKDVVIKPNGKVLKHYREKGYNAKVNEELLVKVEDLTKGSSVQIEVQCDYCKTTFYRKYSDYVAKKNKTENKKDSCQQCVGKKAAETRALRIKEGALVEQEIVSKRRATMQERYGNENPMLVESIRKKQQSSLKEKHGVSNPMHLDFVKDKIAKTNLEKYGHSNVFSSPIIQKKIKETNFKKYGVENPMQNDEIKKRSFTKAQLSMAASGTQRCSKNQKELHRRVGGELNFLEEFYWLDIAFPKEKIYIEYNGSGHDIAVKYKKISKEEFIRKETVRYNILKKKGWKGIFIENPKEEEINFPVLLDEIEGAIGQLLIEGKSHVKIFIK